MHLKQFLISAIFLLANPQFVFVSQAQSFLTFNSYQYYIETNDEVRSYSAAAEQCSQKNATLAVVNTPEIGEFLVENIGNLRGLPFSFYIGLQRINEENNDDAFRWVDGTLLSNGYSNWFVSEPNNGRFRGDGENCVIMGWLYELDDQFEWRDVRCDNWRSLYICQRQIGRTTETTTTEATTTVTTTTPFVAEGVSTTTTPSTTTKKGASTHVTETDSPTTTKTTTTSQPPVNIQYIIIYVAIGGGALLLIIIVIAIVGSCYYKKKKLRGNKPPADEPDVLYETIQENCLSRQSSSVYNEIYRSSESSGFSSSGYGGKPYNPAARVQSALYYKPNLILDESLEIEHAASTLPTRGGSRSNKQQTNF